MSTGTNGDTFNSFSTAPPAIGIQQFMETNSIVAKVAFLLFAIFIFFIVLRLGISVLSYFYKQTSPKLINGMINAKEAIIFNQDPSGNPFINIPRSSNQNDGIEFTWSCWIYINSLKYLEGQYRHVFYKGNNNISSDGLNAPNNAPGLYITPHTNALVVMMNTYNEINKELIIPDIPISKWVNIIIRCHNQTMDVYVNGVISRSIQLEGVPKQNDGDVYVASNGGFDGYISNLWYYDHSLGVDDITRIVAQGPSTKMINGGDSALSDTKANYLSMRWFIRGM